MNFLEMFNVVAKRARPIQTAWTPITDVDTPITEYGLDSLDILMCSIYLCELHGIPEEVGKELTAATVNEFQQFINEHKTQEPESIQAVEAYIR